MDLSFVSGIVGASSSSGKSSSSVVVPVVASILGILLLVAVLAVVFIVLSRKNKKKKSEEESNGQVQMRKLGSNTELRQTLSVDDSDSKRKSQLDADVPNRKSRNQIYESIHALGKQVLQPFNTIFHPFSPIYS